MSEREERGAGAYVAIRDETVDELRELVVGRTIVSIDRDPDSGHDWSDGENSVTIRLDDGAELHFVGWGYDASGLITSYAAPATLTGGEQ